MATLIQFAIPTPMQLKIVDKVGSKGKREIMVNFQVFEVTHTNGNGWTAHKVLQDVKQAIKLEAMLKKQGLDVLYRSV